MAQRVETFWRCDRCGHEVGSDVGLPKDWGRLAFERVDAEIPAARPNGDLCPGCFALLLEWWVAACGPLVQPTPPLPPAPPVFTLEHRFAAVRSAVEQLKGQVEVAFAAAREEPTSLLSGDVVPGSLDGVDDRAELLVAGITDWLLPSGAKRR